MVGFIIHFVGFGNLFRLPFCRDAMHCVSTVTDKQIGITLKQRSNLINEE